ncbi:MAG: hypothetical protein KDA80_05580 [Planctomycetaceae bacterium]|nr:hypothetical protein [Planctomycetaceae bacterium]
MHRGKMKISLFLINVAVAIGAFSFLPGRTGFSYSWGNEVERVFKEILFSFAWQEFVAIMGMSICTTTAIYWFIDALVGSSKPE